jgi:hypothetical protein
MSRKGESNKKSKSQLGPAKRRRARAEERLAAKRSPKDQLAWLDQKFGENKGAAKERIVLHQKLNGGTF